MILWYPRFADLHGCLELVSSTDSYIERHFTEVLECDEFYSLGADQAGFRLRNFLPDSVPVFSCNWQAPFRSRIQTREPAPRLGSGQVSNLYSLCPKTTLRYSQEWWKKQDFSRLIRV
jgi:hypothetical protein